MDPEMLRRHLDRLAGRVLVRERDVLHGADVGAGEDDVASGTEARHHRLEAAVVVPKVLPMMERRRDSSDGTIGDTREGRQGEGNVEQTLSR